MKISSIASTFQNEIQYQFHGALKGFASSSLPSFYMGTTLLLADQALKVNSVVLSTIFCGMYFLSAVVIAIPLMYLIDHSRLNRTGASLGYYYGWETGMFFASRLITPLRPEDYLIVFRVAGAILSLMVFAMPRDKNHLPNIF